MLGLSLGTGWVTYHAFLNRAWPLVILSYYLHCSLYGFVGGGALLQSTETSPGDRMRLATPAGWRGAICRAGGRRRENLDRGLQIEYILFMGSTTVHIPDDILERVDRLAARRGVSRNKIVIKALSEELSRDQGEWPENFFEPPKDPEARALLEEATQEMEAAVARSRQNRGAPGL